MTYTIIVSVISYCGQSEAIEIDLTLEEDNANLNFLNGGLMDLTDLEIIARKLNEIMVHRHSEPIVREVKVGERNHLIFVTPYGERSVVLSKVGEEICLTFPSGTKVLIPLEGLMGKPS